jgi:parallel beta-helix repeat protein
MAKLAFAVNLLIIIGLVHLSLIYASSAQDDNIHYFGFNTTLFISFFDSTIHPASYRSFFDSRDQIDNYSLAITATCSRQGEAFFYVQGPGNGQITFRYWDNPAFANDFEFIVSIDGEDCPPLPIGYSNGWVSYPYIIARGSNDRHRISLKYRAIDPSCDPSIISNMNIGDIQLSNNLIFFNNFTPLNCTITTNDSIFEGQEVVASVPLAGIGAKYEWNISEKGEIKSKMPFGNRIIWKALKPGNVTIKINVTDSSGINHDKAERMISEKPIEYVNIDKNFNDKINSSKNKILYVRNIENNTFNDTLVIRVQNIMIKSLSPLGASIHARGANWSIIVENTSGVYIEGFKVNDSKGGIIISNSSNCGIINSTIYYENLAGIYIFNSSNNNIANNIILPERLCANVGVGIENSSGNYISRNNITIGNVAKSWIFTFKGVNLNNTIIDRFASKIFDVDNGINCSLNCDIKSNKLHCLIHSENRRNCETCRLCAIIENNNKFECIV